MMTTPVFLNDILKFEEMNPSIAINVFSYKTVDRQAESRIELLPEYISRKNYDENIKTANLLYIENARHGHYLGIKNVSRLIGENGNNAKTLCFNCMLRVPPDKLVEHKNACFQHLPQKIKLPLPDVPFEKPVLRFKNFQHCLRTPFVVYADFESVLSPVEGYVPGNKIMKIECVSDTSSSYTKVRQVHVPCSWSYVVVDVKGNIFQQRHYKGEDCVDVFLRCLTVLAKEIVKIYKYQNTPIKLTSLDKINFAEAKKCFVCEKEFDEPPMKDHCHITGEYRGAICRSCNRIFVPRRVLPVLIHNLKSYDANLILRGLETIGKTIKIIPSNNSTKFMGFKVDELLFLDTYNFMPMSLDNLVKTLDDKDENFKLLYDTFGKKARYLKRKGVFFYDYLTSFSVFDETNLPGKEHFFNSLTGEHISDEDYTYAKKLYKIFDCKNLWDYCLLYLKCDTLLLGCVFESFRDLSLKNYSLDPTYYFSTSGLAFDAALKFTKVELELFDSVEMYNFVESGLRGGVSVISKRYSKAENIYTHPDKDFKNKLQTYLLMIDVSNLYGYALQKPLPINNFEWVPKKYFSLFDPTKPKQFDESVGSILEVDLDYPAVIHQRDNEYPLAVEKRNITFDQLSPYQKSLLEHTDNKYDSKQKKLLGHFYPRKNYVVAEENLRYYCQMGLKVTKIHRILRFNQKCWLQSFVLYNANKRALANSNFLRNYYKLLNNSVYGKSIMNKRNRINIKLVRTKEQAKKQLRNVNFKFFNRVTKGLYSFASTPNTVVLNSPIYVGFSVLEASKLHMYIWHYNRMKVWFDNITLLASDTDSYCYEIVTDKDLYEELYKYRHEFDFSDYPSQGPESIVRLKSDENKKVMGKMKDDLDALIPLEFIGLCSKAYSLLVGNTNKTAAKGCKTIVKKKFLNHDIYKKVLFDQNILYSTALYIRNQYKPGEDQKMCTVEVKKNSLSSFDSKRFIKDCGIDTYAYGHVDSL